ncbi:MAG: hypothetical protein H6621_03470 [Halobacteriovoraceae bacterium]|nr:hypothetical protein [Halobacteriovoraceae bacterium]MCB9094107.1 hypothetical protein [Halobacteriovoraceae bacterium]
MENLQKIQNTFLVLSIAIVLLVHVILLFLSSQILVAENKLQETRQEKFIVDIKPLGEKNKETNNKILMQAYNAKKRNRVENSTVSQTQSPSQEKNEQKEKTGNTQKSFKKYIRKDNQGESLRKFLPYQLQNSRVADSNALFSLEIPEGLPEDQLNRLTQVFYSFYKRIGTKYISTIVDKYFEYEREKPHMHIPVNEQEDSTVIRASYDEFGNVLRIRVLKKGKYAYHQKFFSDTIEAIQSIPNPPKQLLDSKKQFHVIYSLEYNPRT